MAVHFHPLTIRHIRKETPDCISVCFDVPESLRETFRFREGQNITIKKVLDGEELRRSYSICAAPYEGELKVAIKKVDGGRFSSFANEQLCEGDVLEVLPPTGKFNAHLRSDKAGEYLAIAAGSGITPVISIIKHCLANEPGSRFTLLYNNRSRASIIFFEELEALKNTYMQRFNLINILSRELMDAPLLYGRINEEKLRELGKLLNYDRFNEIYICGPEKLIVTCSEFLEKKGIDKKNIHFELFTTPGQQRVQSGEATTEDLDTSPKSRIHVTLDGRTIEFDLAYQGQSILDAALKQGADLPFACKGGVCCTCRAKLLEGSVHMDVNYALEQEEMDRGFILTCQSHPRTGKVVIDFDEK